MGRRHLCRRHLCRLKQNRRVTCSNLLTTGRLYDYLRDIDTQANEQLALLIRQMAKAGSVTERLKAEDQPEWVRRMNSIRNRAEKIISSELICNKMEHWRSRSAAPVSNPVN